MNDRSFFRQRIIFTSIITAAIWGLLIWDYFNGGVPSHHILNKENLPEISNWWGGLLLPLVTWFLLARVVRRLSYDRNKNLPILKIPSSVIYNFLGSLLFGVLLSTFFKLGYSNVSGIMIQSVLVLGLFLPFYRAEFILGFIIGMTYTFGTVLPTAVASILAIIGAGLFLYIRPLFIFIFSKFLNPKKTH